MARKSRKNTHFGEKKTPNYKAAIYARLSVEDKDMEDSSIETQILIAQKFLEEQEDLTLIDTYIDNGQTGTNFHRPAFCSLLQDLQRGRINCIIVKDLSRFGRNYLETGDYLENIFPQMGVRFISVNDNFDSNLANAQDALMVSLKSILHDSYAKDISKKVSTAIDVKKKNGKFMSRIAPYGYVPSKADKYQLEIQKEEAEIVKNIFRWRMEGMGPSTIARKLNDLGVPTQRRRRFLAGYSDGKEAALWRGSTVLNILKNPCYFGCLVERKTQRSLCKGGVAEVIPQEKWNIIKNAHEPIIVQEYFDKVQEILQQSAQQKNMVRQKNALKQQTENVFRGLLICGECGSVLQRDGGYYPKDGSRVHHFYNCPRKYLKAGGCSASSVGEKELREAVFQVFGCQLALLFDDSDIELEFLKAENAQALTHKLGSAMIEKIIVNHNHYCIYFAYPSEYEKAVDARSILSEGDGLA